MTDHARRSWRGVSRRTRIAVAVVLLAAGVLTVATRGNEPAVVHSSTVRVPSRGASAEFLGDGSPVWVVRHNDGSVSVLGAVSRLVGGVGFLAEWCERSSGFEDLHGVVFDEYGTYASGPGQAGLVVYDFIAAGPDKLRVTRDVGRTPRGEKKATRAGTATCEGRSGELPEGTTWHDASDVPTASARESANGEFRRFRGNLVSYDGAVRLCVPSRARCKWSLRVPGVVSGRDSGTGGPGTFIGRPQPGPIVTDLIVITR